MSGSTNQIDEELLKQFERLVEEGGTENPGIEIQLEPRFDCDKGFHKWKWYVGFRVEQYYYCEYCDAKDHDRPPPPKYPKLIY